MMTLEFLSSIPATLDPCSSIGTSQGTEESLHCAKDGFERRDLRNLCSLKADVKSLFDSHDELHVSQRVP
jgi:hypothetical protein